MCPQCETFGIHIEIHGPAQLRRIVTKIQAAISRQILRSTEQSDAAAFVQQPDFVGLDLSDTLPDVMSYQFECCTCAQAFRLECENYHGSGGCWRSIRLVG